MIRKVKIGVLIIVCFGAAITELSQAQVSDSSGINGNDRNNILITDMVSYVDSKFINEEDNNLWKAIPYETGTFSGVMIGDGGGPEPVPVTLRLGREGNYHIYLGIYSGYSPPRICVKLSNDVSFQTIDLSDTQCKDDVYERGAHIYEIPWKDADLSGQDIILKGTKGEENPGILQSALAFIRLEPITLSSERNQAKDFFPLTITNDGHGIFNGPLHT